VGRRDGFHWWRQYDGDYQAGGATPRRPFMAQSWPVHTWRNSGVQSVGGGLVLDHTGDRLMFYASGQLGLPFDPPVGATGGNSSMGMASLRR